MCCFSAVFNRQPFETRWDKPSRRDGATDSKGTQTPTCMVHRFAQSSFLPTCHVCKHSRTNHYQRERDAWRDKSRFVGPGKMSGLELCMCETRIMSDEALHGQAKNGTAASSHPTRGCFPEFANVRSASLTRKIHDRAACNDNRRKRGGLGSWRYG